MAFDAKKALEAWKKAKPLLLTDTGISDYLRTKVPTDAKSPKYLSELNQAHRTLLALKEAPKIKAEKKAAACLEQIAAEIEKDIKFIKDGREYAVKHLAKFLVPCKAYFEKGRAKWTEEVLEDLWDGIKFAKMGKSLGPLGYESDPPLQSLMSDWMAITNRMDRVHQTVRQLYEKHAKKANGGLQSDIFKCFREFEAEYKDLEKNLSDVKGLPKA